MNGRNVEALTKAIAEVLASPDGWRAMAKPRAMAEGIVACCAAVVPSALTGSDAKTAVHAALDYDVGIPAECFPP